MDTQNLIRRLVRRLGMVGLAVALIVAAAGFFYVARLTQVHAAGAGDSRPSPLALFALAGLAAAAGVGTLRFAMDRHDEPGDAP
jgi:ABC-type Fe3+ transport system permease subunit